MRCYTMKGYAGKILEVDLTKREKKNKKLCDEDVNNFIGKYTDKDGYINKPTEYHRALAIAMNPEKFAQFCYEQGKADAVESSARKSKNIDMEMRRAPETTRKGALQIKSVSPSSNNNGLRIRSAKRT